MEFLPFPKIARLSRNIVVTEKIDGTNASIYIPEPESILQNAPWLDESHSMIFAGSRTKWITPVDDNYGFAKWVLENKEELLKLGPGHHFGEWWGQGIQRKYGLSEKRFSLFNTGRWNSKHNKGKEESNTLCLEVSCCHVVPLLIQCKFDSLEIDCWIDDLIENGSAAAPGFMDPEGIVIWHEAARQLFKKTIKGDEKPKGSKE